MTDAITSDIVDLEMENHLLRCIGGVKMIADKSKLGIAMARACLNTYDLAKKADMPVPTVNNVISGRSVKPATIGKVAKALDVDVTELI